MRYTLFAFSSLLATLHALTITSPSAGSAVDPSQPITITWTSSPSDPSTFNLFFIQSAAGNTNQVATNVATSSGSYTVPANTILSYGSGYAVVARSTAGDQLATTGTIILAYGATVTTKVNGQLSLVATTGASASSGASASNDNPFTFGDATTTDPSVSTATTGTDSTITSRPFTTHGPESLTTTLSETGSETIIGGATSSTAASSSTSTGNAQVRASAGKEVVGVAGLLVGLLALVA